MKNFIPMVVASCAALLTACVSAPIQLSSSTPAPAGTERRIEAKSCGFQLLLLLPLGVNGRQYNAYQALLRQAGADPIKDVQVEESWTYAFVGTMYCTRFVATAVRPDKAVSRKKPVAVKPKPAPVEAAPVIAPVEAPVAPVPETMAAAPVAEPLDPVAPLVNEVAAVPASEPALVMPEEIPMQPVETTPLAPVAIPEPLPVTTPAPVSAPVSAPVVTAAPATSRPTLAVSVEVRTHPHDKARVIQTLPAGTPVKWGLAFARSASGNWTFIEAGDVEGWVPQSVIRK